MTCIITGANSGIGRAAALQLAKKGMKVVIACRDHERGRQAKEWILKQVPEAAIVLMNVDMSSMASILSFVQLFIKQFDRVDVLIHNAANFDHSHSRRCLTEEGFEKIFATNYLGPVLMTRALLPLIKKSNDPRIVTVGTRGLDFYPFTNLDLDDLQMEKGKFTVAKAYYNSKLAHIMFTLEFAKRFGHEIKINCVRVTNVKLGEDRLLHLPWFYRAAYSIKKCFSISPEEMAETYTYLAIAPLPYTGLYFDEKQRIVSPPKQALNEAERRKLWNITESLFSQDLKPKI